MNLKGSYRALLRNSIAAMLAAIEIYNKPQIAYRDECFSILLVNAWELLAKAILSKSGQRIYYPKRRKEIYKTFSLGDALQKAENYFPAHISYEPVARNVEAITKYRDNAVHFYNQPGFSVVIYGLAQTAIVNYKDLTLSVFGVDVADEMTISLLPLGLGVPPDPIEFLRRASGNPPRNRVVAQYLHEISQTTRDLEEKHLDTGRFLTVFSVSLQSTKKITSADVVVGVVGTSEDKDALVVQRRIDPNVTHPLRQSDILSQIGFTLNGVKFSQHTFTAIAWKYKLKEDDRYHWCPAKGGSRQYSRDIIPYLKKLTQDEIRAALKEYRGWLRGRSSKTEKSNKR